MNFVSYVSVHCVDIIHHYCDQCCALCVASVVGIASVFAHENPLQVPSLDKLPAPLGATISSSLKSLNPRHLHQPHCNPPNTLPLGRSTSTSQLAMAHMAQLPQTADPHVTNTDTLG